MSLLFGWLPNMPRRKQGADKPHVDIGKRGPSLYTTPAEALPPMSMPVLPHCVGEYHGSESVPVAETISINQLQFLSRDNKAFFQNLVAPAVKHV